MTMKIAIIGAGNMGSAMARAFAGINDNHSIELTIANRSQSKLDVLKQSGLEADYTTDISKAAVGAQLVVFAVKPYAMEEVARQVHGSLGKDAMVFSVAAGVGLGRLKEMLGGVFGGLFYAIPNTAVGVGEGVTFVATDGGSDGSCAFVESLLSATGKVFFIDEKLMPAVTALCSCGIAYVFKFIQAAVQAGVELGLRPDDALRYFTQTVAGAARILKAHRSRPQEEIDAVTTPGGMTIKGVNSLDHNGFTSAVISAILSPLNPPK